ncbi:predicted protein [Naegleria gruberi]|uniref:Predicted protein n=1 Tax=Naegleria gruberi TaxID=5762 RepID=D2W2L1_NAEGR|nr:uncharacterized protein NAEGRDRAFT_75628 [Naegleria gruberi]EFC36634.1 predicted protein [Naegleria gruberi]|eukprot:XP_002669378.1 predicted protein [Naegleria gruberi strain NEG-M]
MRPTTLQSLSVLLLITIVLYIINCITIKAKANNNSIILDEGKFVKLLRHGQAYHNLLGDANIRDPTLTPKGIEQSRQVNSLFVEVNDQLNTHYNNIKELEFRKYLIIVSPLKRTIETAIYALSAQFIKIDGKCNTLKDCIKVLQKYNIKLLLQPLIQEREAGKLPCDTGVELKQLDEEFYQHEFNILNTTFMESKWYEPKMEIRERMEKFKYWLDSLNDSNNIIIFTHHGFLMELTNGMEFENCEMKKFVFKEMKLIPTM